ncbi:MAG: (deoxy)nucleoside triphosphate pyrophosphohydrolase [Negativicutes bacterium]|nr:(deoxy)nucleoside triphosphate pyrophosphohydrolase [Negativicutes bacterium]
MKELEVVAGIIVCGEEILCMQRDKARYDYISYKFEFPGGKIEKGEKPTEALKRELTEELEMKVKVDDCDFFMEVDHTYSDFQIKMKSFICQVQDKKFTMKEHIAFKWLKKEHLMELDWAEADKPIVKKLVEG